jgi:hypothetical protein
MKKDYCKGQRQMELVIKLVVCNGGKRRAFTCQALQSIELGSKIHTIKSSLINVTCIEKSERSVLPVIYRHFMFDP